jgi:hypothetical protein
LLAHHLRRTSAMRSFVALERTVPFLDTEILRRVSERVFFGGGSGFFGCQMRESKEK